MAISSAKALQEIEELTSKAEQDPGGYWHGVLIGACGAYMMAEVITMQQYITLTEFEATA